MATTQDMSDELPPQGDMDRDDLLDAFVTVVNLVEPDHAYHDDPWPITADRVDYSYCRSYYARCGPRKGRNLVTYSTNTKYLKGASRARHLAVIVHEITHITQEFDWGDPVHPPSFWREMAFHAQLLIDEWGAVQDHFGDVSVEDFVEEVVDDPNTSTVDRRYESVEERKRELASYLRSYGPLGFTDGDLVDG